MSVAGTDTVHTKFCVYGPGTTPAPTCGVSVAPGPNNPRSYRAGPMNVLLKADAGTTFVVNPIPVTVQVGVKTKLTVTYH